MPLEENHMAGLTVTADAQFGIPRLLRPYTGFATDYQGQTSTTPIMMSEVVTPPGGQPLDTLAGARTVGYNPNLVSGLPTPIGSRVILWLPRITVGVDAARYIWTLTWRLRNLNDYKQTGQPWHEPNSGFGAPDTSSGSPEPRYVIPAAVQTIMYSESPQPATVTGVATAALRQEDFSTGSPSSPLPLVPGGASGAISQGILDPNVFTSLTTTAMFQVHEVQALGDELIVGCYRATSAGTWDFSGVDALFGSVFSASNPYFGVRVLVGSAP